MNNVVSINSKKFAGLSTLAPSEKTDFEGKFLFAGAVISLILFQTICVMLGDILHSVLFAGSFSIGVIAGLIKYIYSKWKVNISIGWENTPKITLTQSIKRRKTA